MQRKPVRNFGGNLLLKQRVRDGLVLVNNAVLLENIGNNAIDLALSLRFDVMLNGGYKPFLGSFEFVGIIGAIKPREVDVDLVGYGVGPYRRFKRIGNLRDACVRRTAGLGKDDVPAYDVIEREMGDDAALLVATDVNQVEKFAELPLQLVAVGQ